MHHQQFEWSRTTSREALPTIVQIVNDFELLEQDLNLRHIDYESIALPIELSKKV